MITAISNKITSGGGQLRLQLFVLHKLKELLLINTTKVANLLHKTK